MEPKGTRAPELGAFCFDGSAAVAGRLLDAGLDWVCLDGQHGRWDDGTVVAALDLLQHDAARVVVRVRANDAALIGRALDAGAGGVVVPLVDSAAEAADAVAAAHYPPSGRRSFGPFRAAYGVVGDREAADAGTRVVVMVETASGLDAVADIVAVPGVDVVLVGPFDLALALGTDVDSLLAAEGADAPLARVVAAARAAGVTAGAYAGDAARAARLLALGFTWVGVTSDQGAVAAGVASILGGLR